MLEISIKEALPPPADTEKIKMINYLYIKGQYVE